MSSPIDFHGTAYKLLIAADHGGFEQKNQLLAYLRGRGVQVEDCGPH